MLNKIVMSMLLIAYTFSAYANESSGPKIYNEKTTNHGFKEFRVDHSAKKKTPMSPKALYVLANAWDHQTQVNQNVYVTTYHEAAIRNTFNTRQRYHIRYEEACGKMSGVHEFDVDLLPGEAYLSNINLTGVVQPTVRGDYPIVAVTTTTGPENLSHRSNAKLHVT